MYTYLLSNWWFLRPLYWVEYKKIFSTSSIQGSLLGESSVEVIESSKIVYFSEIGECPIFVVPCLFSTFDLFSVCKILILFGWPQTPHNGPFVMADNCPLNCCPLHRQQTMDRIGSSCFRLPLLINRIDFWTSPSTNLLFVIVPSLPTFISRGWQSLFNGINILDRIPHNRPQANKSLSVGLII